MLSKAKAQEAIKILGLPVKAWVQYKDVYLFRVEFPFEGEEDFDPFFSVDVNTGEVREFSVLTDGDLSEIAALTWN